jgi:hypothetical protein
MFISKQILLSLALCIVTANAWATQSFRSVSAVTPVFNVTKSGDPLAPGYLLLITILPYPAAVIITDDGKLGWASPVGSYASLNVQTLNDKPVLTYWNGSGSPNPLLLAMDMVVSRSLDSTYKIQHSISPDLDLVVELQT